MISITTRQLIEESIAVPAFIPLTVCTGYLAAWSANLFGFRTRSLVERFFWSVPLSISISTISCVLLGMFVSLTLASATLVLSALVLLTILAYEWRQLRLKSQAWRIGIHPLGGITAVFLVLWMVIIVASLVDIQSGQKLFMSLTIYDHAQRSNWAESILRTGIPPANPMYFFRQPAAMRYYYFWLVDCAAVAKYSCLSMRAILAGGCVWSVIALASIVGLYLKHFLEVGDRLRRQFVIALGFFAVTGLAFLVDLWNMFVLHLSFPGEAWSLGQVQDWLSFFAAYPHHVVAAVCCLFAFLLAWLSANQHKQSAASVVFIAAALASSFGLSVYVAFAFFLVVILWTLWRVSVEHRMRGSLLLAAGGICALVLLIPYLRSLTHSESKMAGGSIFVPWVREMIPPGALLGVAPFRNLSLLHPQLAEALAKLVLLIPGYAIELGFYFVVLLIFLIPAWRGGSRLTPAQRTLVVLALATLPVMSFLRSAVINVNDFGMHSALFLQIPLVLLASELGMVWYLEKRQTASAALPPGLLHPPRWLRNIADLAIIIGIASTVFKAFNMRVSLPLLEANVPAAINSQAPELSRKAYIAHEGYSALNAAIPHDAVVQFNPAATIAWWPSADFLGVHHQIVTESDQLWCGSELGGDPTGCPAIIAAVHLLYQDASGSQARAVCSQYGMQYLVAYVYDPAWNDTNSWVWTLPPVVAQPKFRALDCRK